MPDINVADPGADEPALRLAFVDLLRGPLMARQDVLWYNPMDYGAVWNHPTPVDNTVAIQTAISEAEAVAGSGTTARKIGVYLPPGETWANGLVVSVENLVIWSPGCWLRSYAAQGAPDYLLTYRGAHGEAGHIFHHSIEGVFFDGRSHANVRGLYLLGSSHFHMDRFSFSGFNGAGAGHALTLDESYDCTFSRGLVAYSGRNAATPALETALEAVQLLSSTTDNCNRILFDWVTFEQNIGLDVASRRPAGGTVANASITFRNCKWEQGGDKTVFAGLYAPEAVSGTWSVEGSTEVNSYHRNGSWLNMALGAGAKLNISESTAFGYKADQPPGGAEGATIRISGTGKARVGGRISDERANGVTFLDSTGLDPMHVEFSAITTTALQDDAAPAGFIWVPAAGKTTRAFVDQGRVQYRLKLAANEAARFFPRGESGILSVRHHDQISGMGLLAARCNVTDSPAVAILAAGANIEATTGALSTGLAPTGGGTAGRITVSAHTDGYYYVKNNTAFAARVVVDFEPTTTW